MCEEQRQLLGTEEESSDRHSSEEDNETDLETVYQITSEQREYYIKQFRAVQPDPNGLLSGHVAKVFFEKSRIPVEELRHIWQLCDVTKDGALSLGEFTAAMHLVVLRRNNIALPPILPTCLMPLSKKTGVVKPAEADLLHLDDDKPEESLSISSTTITDAPSFINNYVPTRKQSTSTNSPVTVVSSTINNNNNSKSNSNSNSPPVESVSPSTKPKSSVAGKEWTNQSSREWTKFTESPTSNVSSPGPKPANFDMQRTAQAVVSDPQILHPVPLRITPVGAEANDEESIRAAAHQRKADNQAYDGGIITIREADASSPKQLSAQHRDSGLQNDLRAIQRPQPKKIPTKNNIGAIPPPPQRESMILGGSDAVDSLNSTVPAVSSRKEAPPPPPR